MAGDGVKGVWKGLTGLVIDGSIGDESTGGGGALVILEGMGRRGDLGGGGGEKIWIVKEGWQ